MGRQPAAAEDAAATAAIAAGLLLWQLWRRLAAAASPLLLLLPCECLCQAVCVEAGSAGRACQHKGIQALAAAATAPLWHTILLGISTTSSSSSCSGTRLALLALDFTCCSCCRW